MYIFVWRESFLEMPNAHQFRCLNPQIRKTKTHTLFLIRDAIRIPDYYAVDRRKYSARFFKLGVPD